MPALTPQASARSQALNRFVAILTLTAIVLPPHTLATEKPDRSPFPTPPSRKGLQVQMTDDAVQLGVRHAALNIDLNSIIDPTHDPTAVTISSDGASFSFRRQPVEALDRQIQALSDHHIVVYLILLAYASGDPARDHILLHPGYRPEAPNRLGAFNTETAQGRQWLKASVQLLASRNTGRVWGYIVGNEVNSHWWWANMGRVTMDQFANSYEQAVRIVHSAVRSESTQARVYLSLEHHWNRAYAAGDSQQAFPGRPFLSTFARLAREHGDFEWHLAFHPYPENLFEPRFWNDQTATASDATDRITFKNLEVLVKHLQKPELAWQGKPRRIILSEQGFHTPEGPDGEAIQAAAFCRAYIKIQHLEGIDAFILHRHVDHSQEGGLHLGLWTNKPGTTCEPLTQKKIYDCFRKADTADWRTAFAPYLPWSGLTSWEKPE